ncbi:alpha-(1,3)-fucosyltransferase 7-like [Ylistrum balloti]|uniref:alpha-(1,3)-fucosyltransferase 7-like n=1 Tax=Ylistrum balloti TaxID=509963 RepID=UPI002905E7AF|nr:alpha-(1,3)-fucosyltransferase 7-like [Ylistrum balloti]
MEKMWFYSYNLNATDQPIVLIHNTSNWINKTSKTVLIWTYFFSDHNWADYFNTAFQQCKFKCIATGDKSKIKFADAVVFHLRDIDSVIPEYRESSQIWIITNAESPLNAVSSVYKKRINSMFNWTMTYRPESTVHSYYGRYIPLTDDERKNYTPINYAATRSMMAASIVSNCADDAHRLKILSELGRYIQLHQYGNCGSLPCPGTEHICRSNKYRFRIALENSICRDYITEKFWNSLRDEVIPVVHWPWVEETSITELVPPKSFINLHDFDSIAHLGRYLIYLANNDTEFNSYFEWKKLYRLSLDTPMAAIELCTKLHQPRRDQEITDLYRWIHNDTKTCRRTHIFSRIKDFFRW